MMRLRPVGMAFLAALMAVSPAVLAQDRPAAPRRQDRPPAIDVSKLPLDLARIERQLRQTQEREEFDGMRLRAYVDVFGVAPRIELFTRGENLTTGPVPWGAPTHQQMLDIMTPPEFRAPAMDFAAFLRWLQAKSKK